MQKGTRSVHCHLFCDLLSIQNKGKRLMCPDASSFSLIVYAAVIFLSFVPLLCPLPFFIFPFSSKMNGPLVLK